ncbi:hypothetical protein BB559_001286 [Furculomyces boomerangus]|uniref:Presequence translocated-associated motor subunit PAM17 n=2 Tax=Harpellales TaxID=61421 RepID=A0A2T9Z2J1_9FUNG|nr:hypothetical protein BB559_001286 [Furculomyces boomerangus]PVZ96638.1 hypothetical protein BB558_007445 [Smittium angustum]PWA01181.1 hypothetical protein BB558_002769 [Smittium angustum]
MINRITLLTKSFKINRFALGSLSQTINLSNTKTFSPVKNEPNFILPSFYSTTPESKEELATKKLKSIDEALAKASSGKSSENNHQKNLALDVLNVNSKDYMDWATFFKLRKSRRLVERITSLPFAFVGMGAGTAYLSTIPMENVVTLSAIDPMVIISGAVVMCGVFGFMGGGFIGGNLWKLINKKDLVRINAKETDYFDHIKNNRSDPRLSSYRNPLPDYYGERIYSVKDYRKWLKKQRNHERNGYSMENSGEK